MPLAPALVLRNRLLAWLSASVVEAVMNGYFEVMPVFDGTIGPEDLRSEQAYFSKVKRLVVAPDYDEHG